MALLPFSPGGGTQALLEAADHPSPGLVPCKVLVLRTVILLPEDWSEGTLRGFTHLPSQG